MSLHSRPVSSTQVQQIDSAPCERVTFNWKIKEFDRLYAPTAFDDHLSQQSITMRNDRDWSNVELSNLSFNSEPFIAGEKVSKHYKWRAQICTKVMTINGFDAKNHNTCQQSKKLLLGIYLMERVGGTNNQHTATDSASSTVVRQYGISASRTSEEVQEDVRVRYNLSILTVDGSAVVEKSGVTHFTRIGQSRLEDLVDWDTFLESTTSYLDENTMRIQIKLDIFGDNVANVAQLSTLGSISGNTFESNNDDQLVLDIGKMMNDAASSDIIIEIGNHSFLAHKQILMARSTFFAGLLRRNLDYMQKNQLILDEFEPETFSIILKYIYTGKVVEILDPELMGTVIQGADRFGLKGLKDHYFRELIQCMDLDNFAGLAILSYLHDGDENVKESVRAFYKNNWETLRRSSNFRKLEMNYPAAFLDGCD